MIRFILLISLLNLLALTGCASNHYVQPQTMSEVVIPPAYVGWWEAVSENARYTYMHIGSKGEYAVAIPNNLNFPFDPLKNIQYKSKKTVLVASKEKNRLHLISIEPIAQKNTEFTLSFKNISGLGPYLFYEDDGSIISYKYFKK